MLEHHPHLLAAEGLELGAFELLHVHTVDHNLAGGDVVELVDHADGGGLARPRQAHDHEELAPVDLEVDVGHADDVAGQALDFLLGNARSGQFQSPSPRLWPEDLVHVVELDDRVAVRVAHASPSLGCRAVPAGYPSRSMSDAPDSAQPATKRQTRGKSQARKPRHQDTTAGTLAPVLDDETAAALTLYNTYLVADREQQAHERALKKAEKAKDDAAAAVRKLNDRKAPAAETAEAEARYRETVEALQRLRGGDTAAPDAGDDNTEDETEDEAAKSDAEDAEDAEDADDADDGKDTASENAEDDVGEQAEDDVDENAEDTAGENADEASVGVEASVDDEDLAGDEPAGVAGQQ